MGKRTNVGPNRGGILQQAKVIQRNQKVSWRQARALAEAGSRGQHDAGASNSAGISVTIGADKDFTTLEAFFKWFLPLRLGQGATVDAFLDPGTYEWPKEGVSTALDGLGPGLWMSSATYSTTDVTIRVECLKNVWTAFNLNKGVHVTLYGLNFEGYTNDNPEWLKKFRLILLSGSTRPVLNMIAPGGSIKGFATAIVPWYGSTVVINSLTIETVAGVASDKQCIESAGAYVSIDGTLDITTEGIGIGLQDGQILGSGTINITDAAIGVRTKGLAVCGGNTMNFTNCAQDANIPLNEIQYSGAYISDNTAALAFKA